MRFLMIDRICELERGKSARGIKNISWDDDFLEEVFPGYPVISPVIISEAAAQLVSWVITEAKEFAVKPVITVVDSYVCSAHARPGDQLEVAGSIENFSDEGALAHGSILLNGKPVIELKHSVCYLYPLHELDPPERARMQFQNLYAPGSPLPRQPSSRAERRREEVPIRRRTWIDRVFETPDPDKIVGIKNVTATEDYFNDHFPRKPILPGVIIINCMVSLAAILAERTLAEQGLGGGVKPVLRRCDKIKFRKFVQPGDQLLIEASCKECSREKSVFGAKITVAGKNAASLVLAFEHVTQEAYLQKYHLSV